MKKAGGASRSVKHSFNYVALQGSSASDGACAVFERLHKKRTTLLALTPSRSQCAACACICGPLKTQQKHICGLLGR